MSYQYFIKEMISTAGPEFGVRLKDTSTMKKFKSTKDRSFCMCIQDESHLCCSCNIYKVTMIYHYFSNLDLVIFFDVCKIIPVSTIGHCVSLNKFKIICTSLCFNSNNLCPLQKINFKPHVLSTR